jgi:[ribosomal protein S5]-alanine N-acetyltransferase
MGKINFTPFPNLTTERLILRQLAIADENELFAIRSDESVAKYLDRPIAKSIEETRQFIVRINNSISRNESIYWAITFNNDSKLIGSICLWNISEDQLTAEAGFELLPVYQGKGIMQEALPVILKYGFENMKLRSIEGEVDPGNLRSIKLMVKNGFVYNRKLKDTVVYSLTN